MSDHTLKNYVTNERLHFSNCNHALNQYRRNVKIVEEIERRIELEKALNRPLDKKVVI